MAYSNYDTRYSHRPSHESTYQSSRDTDAYSRRAQPRQPAMRSSYNESGSYHSTPYYSYEPRYTEPPPPRVPAHTTRYRSPWPPSPSAEDETASLAKEVRSVGSVVEDGGEAKSRGSVDQYPIIEDVEQPTNDERRFVLVSDPGEDGGTPRNKRRRSFAERGNMPHLKTDLDHPPLFTERVYTVRIYEASEGVAGTVARDHRFLVNEHSTTCSESGPFRCPRSEYQARETDPRPPQACTLTSTAIAHQEPRRCL